LDATTQADTQIDREGYRQKEREADRMAGKWRFTICAISASEQHQTENLHSIPEKQRKYKNFALV